MATILMIFLRNNWSEQISCSLAPNWFYQLMAYMHQIRFRLGSAPDPRWGSLQ